MYHYTSIPRIKSILKNGLYPMAESFFKIRRQWQDQPNPSGYYFTEIEPNTYEPGKLAYKLTSTGRKVMQAWAWIKVDLALEIKKGFLKPDPSKAQCWVVRSTPDYSPLKIKVLDVGVNWYSKEKYAAGGEVYLAERLEKLRNIGYDNPETIFNEEKASLPDVTGGKSPQNFDLKQLRKQAELDRLKTRLQASKGSWPITRNAAGGLVILNLGSVQSLMDLKIVVVYDRADFERKWHLPRGGYEAGTDKNLKSAAIREIQEETGVIATVIHNKYLNLPSDRAYADAGKFDLPLAKRRLAAGDKTAMSFLDTVEDEIAYSGFLWKDDVYYYLMSSKGTPSSSDEVVSKTMTLREALDHKEIMPIIDHFMGEIRHYHDAEIKERPIRRATEALRQKREEQERQEQEQAEIQARKKQKLQAAAQNRDEDHAELAALGIYFWKSQKIPPNQEFLIYYAEPGTDPSPIFRYANKRGLEEPREQTREHPELGEGPKDLYILRKRIFESLTIVQRRLLNEANFYMNGKNKPWVLETDSG
jgi:8-oxo-dGTP pyrophosphatase MutT (NUDIX family)